MNEFNKSKFNNFFEYKGKPGQLDPEKGKIFNPVIIGSPEQHHDLSGMMLFDHHIMGDFFSLPHIQNQKHNIKGGKLDLFASARQCGKSMLAMEEVFNKFECVLCKYDVERIMGESAHVYLSMGAREMINSLIDTGNNRGGPVKIVASIISDITSGIVNIRLRRSNPFAPYFMFTH